MTTSHSYSEPDTRTPWLRDDHWKAGDTAWWIFPTGLGVNRTMVDIVDPAEGTVRDPSVIYNDGMFQVTGKFEHIRHRGHSCAACADSVLELLAAGQDEEAAYWGRWASVAHSRFSELKSRIQWNPPGSFTAGTFAPEADLPDWFREITAGHLEYHQAPSMCLGRVWEPIDWPTLIAEHPGELSVLIGTGWTQEHLNWDILATAFRMIEGAGLPAFIDVTVEIGMDGALALWPVSVGCSGIAEHPELVTAVTTALGGIELDPHGCWLLD